MESPQFSYSVGRLFYGLFYVGGKPLHVPLTSSKVLTSRSHFLFKVCPENKITAVSRVANFFRIIFSGGNSRAASSVNLASLSQLICAQRLFLGWFYSTQRPQLLDIHIYLNELLFTSQLRSIDTVVDMDN